MKLGEIVRVARGVSTGNRDLFIISRAKAKQLGIEAFTRPVLGGVRELRTEGPPVVRDHPGREVVIIASGGDVSKHTKLRDYLDGHRPRITSVRAAPIAVSYVGIPRFVANPDGLVVTNALYTVTPKQSLSGKEIVALVERLNAAAARLPKKAFVVRFSPRTLEALEL